MASPAQEQKGNWHEPLRSLKLDAEEAAVAFTEGPYRSSGCTFAWPVAEGPAGLAGEVCCLLVGDCGLSGGGDGIDGIDPRAELALEIL